MVTGFVNEGGKVSQPTWDEEKRLAVLEEYRILDTPYEADFDDIVKMAGLVCKAPISVINFVAEKRQWFKAEIGLGVRETPLDISICSRAILQPGVFVVPDLTQDARFEGNPLVTGKPHLRSYAGALLETDEGLPLGTICVLDYKPRIWTEEEGFVLKTLARHVMSQLDLRRALQERQWSEERLTTALESSGFVGTWDWSVSRGRAFPDARFVTISEGEFDWMTKGETIKDYLKSIYPEDVERVRIALEETLQKGGLFQAEYRVTQKDGSIRWVEARGKCTLDGEGKPMRFPGTAVDTTARKLAEEVARLLAQTTEDRRQELERVVAERTASLKEVIGQMEEFSYSVSHDLRAPLRAMQGYATAVLEDYGDKIDAMGKEYLQRIVSAGARMDRLTQDVLTYSKIPRTETHIESVPLDKLVLEIVEQCLAQYPTEAEISVESPLKSVKAHEPLLAQAISNLVGNAIKFTSGGTSQRIRIWTEERESSIRLWVEDNGLGIKPEYQSRIWGMFERVHPNSPHKGTGIGLAIVRKAVERMGGTVGVESDGITGSKFWLQLPASGE